MKFSIKKVLILIFIVLFYASALKAQEKQTTKIIRDTVIINHKKVNFLLYEKILPKVTTRMLATLWAQDISKEFASFPDWYLFLEDGIILVHPQNNNALIIHTNGMNNTAVFLNLDIKDLKKLAKYVLGKYIHKGEMVYTPFKLVGGKYKLEKSQKSGYIYRFK